MMRDLSKLGPGSDNVLVPLHCSIVKLNGCSGGWRTWPILQSIHSHRETRVAQELNPGRTTSITVKEGKGQGEQLNL